MDATKVIAQYPNFKNDGHIKEVWVAGADRANPTGEPDVVERLFLMATWDEFLEVKWRDFGSELVPIHTIIRIEFKNAGYSKLVEERKKDQNPEDTDKLRKALGIKKG